jgi:3-oxoacyl-[acyl-carrier protein] reductase
LAARGAAVVLNARNQARLDALAARIVQAGGKAVAVPQDIRSFEGATALFDRAVEAFGRVDALFNAAGVTMSDGPPQAAGGMAGLSAIYGGTILDTTEAAWKAVIDMELTAVFNCTKAAATRMVAQGEGGAIISVVGTILGQAGQGAHAAAKAGLLNGIWSWSDELRAYGVSVNGVRGYVRSQLTDPSFSVDAYDFEAGRGRPQVPTEPIAAGELVAWLASADARDITGAYIGLDGPRITVWEPSTPGTTLFGDPGWTTEDLSARLGPILRNRPPRPTMLDVVRDVFPAAGA